MASETHGKFQSRIYNVTFADQCDIHPIQSGVDLSTSWPKQSEIEKKNNKQSTCNQIKQINK